MRRSFSRTALAVFALLVMLCQGTWVLAGTTGGIAGTVDDAQTGRPIAGAHVTIASPSQTAAATTDAQGRYSFVSLAPDTYTLAITSPGYQAFSQAGVTVVADQTQTYNFAPTKALSQIGRVRSRSASDLVKPGQTADVYSISGQLSQNTQALGGGNSMFQTYAALSSVPGVYVPQGTNYGQNNSAPYIRGGDYSQVGFEYDGIPVNRAFDNYVSNTQGITGQQELQVYTGGVPASSAGEGLSGYINQVIKSGTYPATASVEGVIGSPTFYHYLRGEYGGASKDRNFSYYAGTTGWNQSYRYGSNFNTAPNPLLNPLVANFDGTGGANPAPYNAGSTSDINTRETVANLHFGIPHHNGDGGRDDIQVLGSIGRQILHVYDSINDYGGGTNNPLYMGYDGISSPSGFTLPSTNVYNGPVFSKFNPALVSPYYYPSVSGVVSNSVNANGQYVINPNYRGSEDNNNGIFKVQYQKNFGSTAYARIYGYTNYSSWSIYDPVGYLYDPFTAAGAEDYELSTHTRGVSLEFADQITPHHLLQGSASYTYSSVLRANNNTPLTSGYQIQLRDGSGMCYDKNGALTNCYAPTGFGYSPGSYFTAAQTATNPIAGAAAAAGAQYVVTRSGYNVVLNQVTPKFTSTSLSDDWQVSDKLKLNLGVRYNRYIYSLGDTASQGIVGGSNALYFSNFNAEHCYNLTDRSKIVTVTPNGTCATGYAHTNLSDSYAGKLDSSTLEPRLSGTLTISPYDVVRFSAGKYSQPINSAYAQYNVAGGSSSAPDLAAYTARNFFLYGFNTPEHDAQPQLSYNYDFTYEKRLKNAPISFSFTPFYRQTKDQSQSFFLDAKSNFVSGLNVGTLRAFGYELLSRYGDFNRDGLSGQVSFAYTNSKIKYQNFAGTNQNIIDNINNSLIGPYNALTAGGGGSPCYLKAPPTNAPTGVPLVGGACPANSNANPYYNSPLQTGLDPTAYYSPYDLVPAAYAGIAGVGSSASYEVPYTLTAIVQYRKNGWRIVPTAQYDSGFKYGSPYAWVGYDPSSGCDTSTNSVACGTVFRPNPYTGTFDSLGQFKSPGTLTLSMQVAKDLSKRVTATAILANLYRHCFTHGYAWETAGSDACSYGYNTAYAIGGGYLGNASGPTATNALQQDPYGYAPGSGPVPFAAYFSLQVKM